MNDPITLPQLQRLEARLQARIEQLQYLNPPNVNPSAQTKTLVILSNNEGFKLGAELGFEPRIPRPRDYEPALHVRVRPVIL
jgi:hypothetical protein